MSKRGTKQGQKVALETPAPKSTAKFKGRITQFACGVADLAAAQRRFSSSLAATEQKWGSGLGLRRSLLGAVWQQSAKRSLSSSCNSLPAAWQHSSNCLSTSRAAVCTLPMVIPSKHLAALQRQLSTSPATRYLAVCQQQFCSSVMKIYQQSVSSLEQSSLQQSSNKRFLRIA